MRRLRELARDKGVKQILVGLPLRLDGTRGEAAEEAERFAQRLRKQIGLPVETVDERLSSWEAERRMEEELGRRVGPRGKREERISVDSIAAVVILREFLARAEGHQARPEDI
jgi:putative Holliday junction resolvase